MSSETAFPGAPSAAGLLRPTLLNNLTVMWRVVFGLMIRESRTRYGKSDLGYLWALIDPMIQLIVLWIIFVLLQRLVPVPATMPVFLVTGILPYMFWRNCVSRGASAASANLPLLTYPQVKVFDVVVARVLLDGITLVVVVMVFVVGLRFTTGEPFDSWSRVPILQVWAIATLFYFAFCSAVFSSSIGRIWGPWPQVFGYMARPLYFTSGIFFTLGTLPSTFRKYAVFNPIAHMLEWIRTATIPGFVSNYYNPWFIIWFATILFVIGMVIDWVLRLVGHSDESH